MVALKKFQPTSLSVFSWLMWGGYFAFAYSQNGNPAYMVTLAAMLLIAVVFTVFKLLKPRQRKA